MNVLTHHWEKIVMGGVILLILVVVAVNLTEAEPTGEITLSGKKATLAATDVAAQFNDTIQRARSKAPATLPSTIFQHEHLQYSTASKKLMPKWGLIDPETGATVTYKKDSDGDGMPNKWEQKYGLNWKSPADGTADADGDGLTNLQEFEKETDPSDPTSPNLIVEEYRVTKVYRPSRNLEFKNYTTLSSGNSYHIAYKGSTKFLKEGDTIKDNNGTPLYTVGAFAKKTTNVYVKAVNSMRPEDRSELTLTDTKTGDTFTLVMGQTSLYDYSEGKLIRRDDGKEVIVQTGDTVPLTVVDEDATVTHLDADDGIAVFTVGDLTYRTTAENK